MTDDDEAITQEDVQESLEQVIRLLHKQKLVENLVHRQEMPHHDLVENLVHKQNLAELHELLDKLHSADVAYILEALPLEDRLLVWDLVKAERDGDILLEVSDAVRETLIADMQPEELVAATEGLDTDELADLVPDLPEDVAQEVLDSLDAQNRALVQRTLSYPEDTVGALMDFDIVTIRDDISLEVVLRYLRRLGELPSHTDKLFVVDRDDHLQGVLPLKRLLVHDPDVHVAAVMIDEPDVVAFHPEDEADEAANAFDRYDLISAPVVDVQNRLVGRLTVDDMVDFIRQESENEVLNLAGLKEEEDLFASVWDSLKNRWTWLGINLITAFVAAMVIRTFEGSIAKITALAVLMPIVAGIGGNSGNQTITMIVRGLALDQVHPSHIRNLLIKEMGIGLANGLVWGSIVGVVAAMLYRSVALGFVMAGAMILSLILAACAGVLIPLLMHRLGRDPAVGSSVLITALTDSGGFFIFLGLATLILL